MARPEIPSIVVHNGSASAPGSPSMELPMRPLRASCSLSKQTSLVDEEDLTKDCPPEGGDFSLHSPAVSSSSHSPSLPVTPPSPSPAVSPSSPPGVSTPTNSNSPCHPRSLTPSSTPSCSTNPASPSAAACSSALPPQGPGPGGGTSFDGGTMAIGPGGPTGPVSLAAGATPRSRSLDLPQQRSTDSDKESSFSIPTKHRQHYHGSKLKLLQRSHAMQEDSSPPPDIIDPCLGGSFSHSQMSNSLTVCPPPLGCPGGPPRRRLRHQGSSPGSFDGSSPCLSRDSSMEYTDSTGVDLLSFIIQTLHKNQKDRMLLLKIERELVNMVKDPKRTYHKFPHMSSYQRMLVHRVAAYFGMEHNVDQVGTCVIVNKTRNTRLPESRFREHIQDELLPPDEPKRSILRRGFSSFEEETSYKSPDRLGIDSRRSKSFEEREEEYEKVRRRIFSEESFSMEGMGDSPRRFHYPFMHGCKRGIMPHEDPRWLAVDPETHRKHYDNHRIRPSRLPKGESFENPDSLNPRSLRPPVFKSHSFGGYSGGVTVLSRGNSVASNPSSRLSKQDSTGSRFSDHSSSSGYKTQRQDTSSTNVSNTLSTTPSPTAGSYHHPGFGQPGSWGSEGDAQPVMWAVTDLEAVPSGALLINPQNGQPYTNPDGTLYRFDPSNPPSFMKSGCGGHGLHKIMAMQCREREEKRLLDMKGDSGDTDEGIEAATPSPCSKSSEVRDLIKQRSGLDCGTPVSTHSHFYNPAILEKRSFSQENVTEIGNQFRQLSLCTSEGGQEIPSSSVGTPMPSHQGYIMPRQQYPATIYYMPAASIHNLPSGGVKYVYPQYQMAPVQPSGGAVSSTSLTGAPLPAHPPPVPALSNMATLPAIPQPIAGPGPPQPNQVPEANAHLPTGFVPSTYAVVAYPPSGILGPPTSNGTTPHEAGGTTYYCQIAGPAAIAPHAAAGTASNPGGASATASGLTQYASSSTASSTFPVALSYYTGAGVGNNGLYQTSGIPGFPGGMYGAASHSHSGVGSQPPPPPPPPPPHQGTLTFKAPTPPHTPSTQGVSMPLGFNAPGGPGVSPAGQYIAVLPPQQPPTPTSHASHFPTFFRPPIQMLGGSTGTPPPQPIFQYGGVTTPLSNPHPPVYAKPYTGGPSSIHPLIPAGTGNGETSALCTGPVLLNKEESKRYIGGSVAGAGPPVAAPFTGTPTAHLLPRPYAFMPNSLAGGGPPGHFRTPILISAPRHSRPFLPTPGGPMTPLTFTKPHKYRKPKPKGFTYACGTTDTTSSPYSIESGPAEGPHRKL